jgi:hypothetical protein
MPRRGRVDFHDEGDSFPETVGSICYPVVAQHTEEGVASHGLNNVDWRRGCCCRAPGIGEGKAALAGVKMGVLSKEEDELVAECGRGGVIEKHTEVAVEARLVEAQSLGGGQAGRSVERVVDVVLEGGTQVVVHEELALGPSGEEWVASGGGEERGGGGARTCGREARRELVQSGHRLQERRVELGGPRLGVVSICDRELDPCKMARAAQRSRRSARAEEGAGTVPASSRYFFIAGMEDGSWTFASLQRLRNDGSCGGGICVE